MFFELLFLLWLTAAASAAFAGRYFKEAYLRLYKATGVEAFRRAAYLHWVGSLLHGGLIGLAAIVAGKLAAAETYAEVLGRR